MYYVDLTLNGLIFGCMYALMAVLEAQHGPRFHPDSGWERI